MGAVSTCTAFTFTSYTNDFRFQKKKKKKSGYKTVNSFYTSFIRCLSITQAKVCK